MTATTGASDWAKAEIEQALDLGIVPESIKTGGWQNPTTRLAAAELLVLVIEKATNKSIQEIAAENGWDLSQNTFNDTDSPVVTFLKYAGITNGVGDNNYAPDTSYNRAQMVTMIGRIAEVFFGRDARRENPFTDDVPDWAAPYVGYAADNGITNGIGGGAFGSYNVLQNQQTAVFGVRTLAVLNK